MPQAPGGLFGRKGLFAAELGKSLNAHVPAVAKTQLNIEEYSPYPACSFLVLSKMKIPGSDD